MFCAWGSSLYIYIIFFTGLVEKNLRILTEYENIDAMSFFSPCTLEIQLKGKDKYLPFNSQPQTITKYIPCTDYFICMFPYHFILDFIVLSTMI